MFTRLSNFSYGNYKITNIEEKVLNNQTELLIHIQKKEKEFLQLALGNKLYTELMQNLELDENGYWKIIEGADDKWTKLVYGDKPQDDEECCSKDKVWNGLIYPIATIKGIDVIESILTPWLYYFWSLDNRTLPSGVGEFKGNAQGVTMASSSNKRVDAWNEFVKFVDYGDHRNKSLFQYLRCHFSDYNVCENLHLKTMTYYDI